MSRLWRYGLHLGLFFATCLTTTWAGAVQKHPDLSWSAFAQAVPFLRDGLPFSAAIMTILLFHEMGHYIAARIHRVPATLPLFLPLPFGLIGTLGAVIGMRSRISDRDALADIGAAGPLAGLAVALPILAYGLYLSPVHVQPGGGLVEGNSLLYAAMKFAVKGQWLPSGNVDVFLHPVAWAGWVGLLITMINLMPIGQLDGGHVAFAYFGNRHEDAAHWLHRALVPMGLFAVAYTGWELAGKLDGVARWALAFQSGAPWLVWWVLLSVMRRLSGGQYHPPVDATPLSQGRRRLCQLVFVVFLLILTPIPLRVAL